VIDLLGRLRGSVDPRRRADLLARFELDPKVALVPRLLDVEMLCWTSPRRHSAPSWKLSSATAAGRLHHPALQPHPRRDRGGLRPGHDHPRRTFSEDGHAGRPTPSDPHVDHGRPRRAADALATLPACMACASKEPACTARWMPMRWMQHFAISAPPACAASRVARRHWRNLSCATTPSGPGPPRRRWWRHDAHVGCRAAADDSSPERGNSFIGTAELTRSTASSSPWPGPCPDPSGAGDSGV
jgi:hypothetical protein